MPCAPVSALRPYLIFVVMDRATEEIGYRVRCHGVMMFADTVLVRKYLEEVNNGLFSGDQKKENKK